MKGAGLLLLSFYCFTAAAQDAYWQQQVNYTISVTLNDGQDELNGFERMEYINHSPDTLHFIWIHVWPNAYKNDRTAFSDQLLENGRKDFYFSSDEQRGYINTLSFKVNGNVAAMEDHPQHQDIVKLLLPSALSPGDSCTVETPFHVKLPYNFSRGGHVGHSYQATQWYPKAAVYDKKGWHEMPYLDQGEFYSDFGNYTVSIAVPANYIVAATGEKIEDSVSGIAKDTMRTIVYKQDKVIDFAWFADKDFIVQTDTMALPSGRIIHVASYSLPAKQGNDYWKNTIRYIKKTVQTRSRLLGEYPYGTVAAVQANTDYGGGMEYPTITLISDVKSDAAMEDVTEHEVGHNWLYGILATNERDHPWMDEGMNKYYDQRYGYDPAPAGLKKNAPNDFRAKQSPVDYRKFMLNNVIAEHVDQPVETVSEKFSELNYRLIAYNKASQWMKLLEQTLGTSLFDSCMKIYYSEWKFKHPYPEDFKKAIEQVSGRNLNNEFDLLSRKGDLINSNVKRTVKLASFYSFRDTDKYKYIFIAPAAGYNIYDKLMVGLTVHNYTFPAEKFQYFLAPLYAAGSKQLNGIGTLNYHWYPANGLHKIEAGLNASRFSSNHNQDTTGKKIFGNFSKLVPYLQFYFRHDSKSRLSTWIDVRSFIINEKQFDNYDYITGSDSLNLYPKGFSSFTRYINQLSFNAENTRVLYPYNCQLQVQQGDGFYRVNATADYFFNYAKGGGMQLRLFAAKFGYLGERNNSAYLYQPKLLAGNGTDDYTNSNYFLGRTASTAYSDLLVPNGGLAAQQIMINNTGGLKIRLDPYSSVQGYSENWVAAANVNTSLPEKLFPVKLPLKLFFDVGSYSEAWKKNSFTPKFLYAGGLQLSLFKNVLNIYAPLIYSNIFKEQLKTDAEANKFSKKITFSIDLQNLTLKKLFPQFSF